MTTNEHPPDVSPETIAEVQSLTGQVAADEFAAARAPYRDEMLTWAHALPSLSDAALREECERWIWEGATANAYRGNYNHVHFKCTAVSHEATRRHHNQGHAESCHGPTIYSRAHDRAMREAGHTPTPVPCTCGAGA